MKERMIAMHKEEETRGKDAVNHFNEEAAYSLSLNILKSDSAENIRLAKRIIQVSELDYKGITGLAHIYLTENPALTNEEVAEKVPGELSVSHPNRFIKKLAKRMTTRKRGVKDAKR